MDQKEMKSIIKATLISNPMKTTVRQLQSDVYKSEGFQIPYRQFGYTDIVQYLQSMPDAVQVIGCGPHAEVRVVLNEKSAHVALMVAKQRTAVKKPKYSRYGYGNVNNRPKQERARHVFGNGLIDSVTNNNFQRNGRISRPAYNQLTFETEEGTDYYDDDFDEEAEEFIRANERFTEDTRPNRVNERFTEEKRQNRVTEEKRPSRVSERFTEENRQNRVSERFFGQKISSGNNERVDDEKIPLEVQRNLDELIKKFSGGLSCSKLPTEYKKYFRKELNYADYGFKSLIQLCCELTRIFKFVQPGNGDYILFHVAYNTNTRTDIRQEYKTTETRRQPAFNAEGKTFMSDNLPDILNNLRLSPLQIFPMGGIIPPQEILSKPGDYIDIQIAEVYNPSKFWFIMDVHDEKLTDLMDGLQDFYSENFSKYLIPSCEIQEGLYCVASYVDAYHRGVITSILPQSTQSVRVFFFDYGTVTSVSISGLCYLNRDFAKLPAQAKRGTLANVRHPREQETWSTDSSHFFLDLIKDKVCIAEIYAINENPETYELIVADTSGADDVFVNDSLVSAGYAELNQPVRAKKKKRISNNDLLVIMKEMVTGTTRS